MKEQTSLEEQLWAAADSLRANSPLKSTQYAPIVLGLIFLRFATLKYQKFEKEIQEEYEASLNGRNPKRLEDVAVAKCGYFLPAESHFDFLLNLPEGKDIPAAIKAAMEGIEEHKDEMKGTLPKDEYLLLETSLAADLLKMINNIPSNVSGDVFGKVYEYFLGKFAMKEGQGGGEFYTPTSVVRLMVEMIEPFGGMILDPACGSGGMFVQSSDFVRRHRHDLMTGVGDLMVCGVEKEQETVKLARMNMFLHGLRNSIYCANSYYEDPHECFGRFDFVMANPPFNVDDVNLSRVKDQKRFNTYGIPQNKTKKTKDQKSLTVPNANYLWINLFATSLKPEGRAALVMANSASDAGGSEKEIRQNLIESGVISCMLTLPTNMFYTVTLPATLWFFDKARTDDKRILFIDARNIFRQIDRAHREFTPEQIRNIACIRHLYYGDEAYYHNLVADYDRELSNLSAQLPALAAAKAEVEAEAEQWWTSNPQKKILPAALRQKQQEAVEAYTDNRDRHAYVVSQREWLVERFPDGKYRDVIGLCKAAELEGEDGIIDNDYSLNAGRYVGVVIEDDGMTAEEFRDEMLSLNAEFASLSTEAKALENEIEKNLKELLGYSSREIREFKFEQEA